MAHAWAHIADYRSDDIPAQDELSALTQVWTEHRGRLAEKQAYREFEEKLIREWSIETGLIERLYTLDRKITQLLIERGLRTNLIPNTNGLNPEALIAMISDHKSTVESVFASVKNERPLSTSYIKELHALITKNQPYVDGIDRFGRKAQSPLLRGEYKKLSNNPRRQDGSVHEYCPPEHVASEMDRLLELHHSHAGVAPEVEAAWLHHRFTQIHPFQDGNGRVARALATLVFIKAGWLPLVIRDRDRVEYINALEEADSGNLEPLVNLFARLQRLKLVRAISIADDA
ncbi:MAG: Fic family protein [Bacteroidetes bacterium]|nr:Fic family protein [Bacteroidota bacterium]